MDHSVLTILDLGIITAYLVIMVLVGVYSVRRIQNTKDYYVAGRSFGPMVLMATVCATTLRMTPPTARAPARRRLRITPP